MASRRALSRRVLLLAGCAAMMTIAGRPAAATPQSGGRKIIIMILRGAMDGLAALPKVDEASLRAHRSSLIDPDAIGLAEGFAVHSAMPTLAALFRGGELAFAPAVAGPYRERSHFEAQDLLECGGVASVSDDGWLNRALQHAPDAYSAVSIGPSQPLILRGAAQSVSSWSPAALPEASEDTLNRLLDLYEKDSVLKASLAAAIEADKVAGSMDASRAGAGRAGPGQYVAQLTAAGQFLAQPDGPEIAVVSLDGWDTHAGQNQALHQRFSALDSGIRALKETLGEAWRRTALIAVSEFGRTVRVNGAQGTDHGTAGLAILAGGAVRGGRMLGDWPGLEPAALFENRDLRPTIDVRALFKGLLREHLGWDRSALDAAVFPESAALAPVDGLVRT